MRGVAAFMVNLPVLVRLRVPIAHDPIGRNALCGDRFATRGEVIQPTAAVVPGQAVVAVLSQILFDNFLDLHGVLLNGMSCEMAARSGSGTTRVLRWANNTSVASRAKAKATMALAMMRLGFGVAGALISHSHPPGEIPANPS
jgi:hypothetical protein